MANMQIWTPLLEDYNMIASIQSSITGKYHEFYLSNMVRYELASNDIWIHTTGKARSSSSIVEGGGVTLEMDAEWFPAL
jgi:hypothetical protein